MPEPARPASSCDVSRGGGYLGYISSVTAMPDTIEKQPDVTQKLVTGLTAAMQYTRQNPDESAEIAARNLPGLTPDVAKLAIKNVPFDPRITKQTYETFDEVGQQLLGLGKIKKAVDSKEVVITKFMDAVARDNPELLSDLKPAP